MSSSATPDLSNLAALAGCRGVDLRPMLLKAQTELFLAAPARDAATIASFEALALGLLPLVDNATALFVARSLVGLPDAPESVLAALVARGTLASPDEIAPVSLDLESAIAAARAPAISPALLADLVTLDLEAVDLALAANADARLGGRPLQILVDRARRRPPLAALLLARPDLTIWDEAVLYREADAERRGRILAGLAENTAYLDGLARPRVPASRQREVAETLTAIQTPDKLWRALVLLLGLGDLPERDFAHGPDQDLLALGLRAAGLTPEECIHAFLTLAWQPASHVGALFRLAGLVRQCSAAVAGHVVRAATGAAGPAEAGREHKAGHLPAADAGSRQHPNRNYAGQPGAARQQPGFMPGQAPRDRETSARSDLRTRPTRGLGRS